MTKTPSEYNPLQEDNPKNYTQEKQEEFMRLLKRAYELKKIDELNFRRLSLEVFTGSAWQEAFTHYKNLYDELTRILKEQEINQIQERLIKGAEMIDNEPDPHKRKQYLAVYDQLLKKLEMLKSA